MQSSLYYSQPDPLQQVVDALRNELFGLFQVNQVGMQARGRAISFTGRLVYDADASYNEIQRRFEAHGYTPVLRHENGEDVLVAFKGVVEQARTGNPLINVLLFLATVATTLAAGAMMSGENLIAAVRSGSVAALLTGMVAGAPFAITLLGILGVHEFGHYIAARLHKVAATLPYFIPMPFSLLGTLGAFIAIKSPMRDRKVLFDIGLAGPIAGFLVALPLLVMGLLMSDIVPSAAGGLLVPVGRGGIELGSSLLVTAVVGVFRLFGDVPAGMTIIVHPIFFAAWLGLLITGINLLPVGQLDGGHVSYALFGKRAHTLALLVFVSLIIAGLTLSQNWFTWAFFVVLGGLRHPAPMNDISGVGWGRKVIGVLTILLFFIVVIPVPFR